MRARRRATAFATAIATSLALAAPAHAAPVSDAYNKPLEDGCQRNVPGLLTYTTPEWVWVNSAQVKNGDNTRQLTGVARDPHTAGEDLPENHTSYDFDFNVVPDAPYLALAGGSPSANGGKGSGNWDKSDPSEYGTLHLEWESRTVPTFAWPTEGDRVNVWGQWIWDCGHWGEGFDFSAPGSSDPTAPLTHNGDYLTPGEDEELVGIPDSKQIRGEQTELHPLEAMIVNRAAPWAAPARESQTDAFMSTDGNGAHAEEKCSHDLAAPAGQPFRGPDFTACVHESANEYQSLAGKTFEFFVAAPPKPSPGAQLRYRAVERFPNHGASEQVVPESNGIRVRVSFANVPSGTPESFGKSYFVGWENDRGGAPEHLRLTIDDVHVLKSLDPNPSRPSQSGVPPGEYNLYVETNGYWRFLGGRGPSGAVTGGTPLECISGLGTVNNGDDFPNPKCDPIDFFVPPGKPVHVFVDSRECDLPRMDPCAATPEVSDGNDSPGDHADSFPSAAAAVGRHVLKPEGGAYTMTYTLARASGGGPSEPGSSGVASSTPKHSGASVRCADVRAPRSLFTRRTLRASRHGGIRIRGTARDRGCARGVARVTVALALRLGHHSGRCRYLGRDRRLGPATSCRNPTYVRVRGKRRWRFAIRGPLPAGTYVLRSRSIDRAGNVEIKRRLRGSRRNFLAFKVR